MDHHGSHRERQPRTRQVGGFWYLASPYSKYPLGLDEAFRVVAGAMGRLIRARVPVFCPIVHTHPVARIAHINPLDHEIWLPADEPFMHAARGMIRLEMATWEQSYGMRVEESTFLAAGKPVVRMQPGGPIPAEVLP